MKKLIFPLSVLLLFYLGSVAYEKDQSTKLKDALERNQSMAEQLATVNRAMVTQEVAFNNKQDEEKKMLKLLFPDSAAQIERIFAPQSVTPAGLNKPEKEGDKK